MFLSQIVFSFRLLCLKAVVTDFVLPGMRGEEERGDGGLLVKGGWIRDRICAHAIFSNKSKNRNEKKMSLIYFIC